MTYLTWERIREGLVHRRPWIRGLTAVAVCLLAGLPVGAIIGLFGWLYGSAALVGLVLGYLMLREILVGLVVLIAVICLLPFAALPINLGFSPTLLDLVLLMLFFVWIGEIATRKRSEFIASPPTTAVLAFVSLAVVSFIAGLTHSRLTANVIRHFAEILLSVLVVLLVMNTVRTTKELKIVVTALMLFGFAAAMIGVVLYVLPEEVSVRLLSLLRVVRYPTGPDVLRYIEDNPELPLRAVSTSIDPNVLGGMLIFVITLTLAQLPARQPLLPRKWLWAMLITMALCLILTFSRGSFAGAAAALLLLGVLRHRRMLWVSLVVVAVMLALPPSQVYVRHLVEGLRGQDLATQMRLGEYKDAFILISRHPWLGVGFAGTPEIDTYLGVSCVYLLIAEEMGVLGLLAFLAALGSFLARFLGAWRRCPRDCEVEPLLLGTCLAVVGAMTGGVLDHYLFNLDFPHATALLWLTVGLGAAAIRLRDRQTI